MPKLKKQILKRGICPLILSNSSEANQEMLQINLLRLGCTFIDFYIVNGFKLQNW